MADKLQFDEKACADVSIVDLLSISRQKNCTANYSQHDNLLTADVDYEMKTNIRIKRIQLLRM